jgi:hypothetical protein
VIQLFHEKPHSGGKENGACVVIKTDKPEETVTVLSQNGIKPLDSAF